MTPSSIAPIDTDGVVRLLELHFSSENEVLCPEMRYLAQVLAGEGTETIEATVDAHLAECEWCRSAVTTIGRLTATGILGPLPDIDIPSAYGNTRKGRVSRVRLYGFLAASVVFLLFGAFLVTHFSSPERERPEAELVIKGDSDKIHVAVQRGTYRFTLRPGGRLQEGDETGLFYSTKKAGYLAVIGLDSDRHATVIFPVNGTESASLGPGDRTPLPVGATVSSGDGCEWLIAVFSEAPMNVAMLRNALENTAVDHRNCTLNLNIDGARTVQVLPYLL